MDHVEWSERPQLRDPTLVVAFKGWNDAGESATAALGFLADQFDATEVARIDPEEFYDFTAVRPQVRLAGGRTRVIDWPENSFSAAQIPGAEHDLILFQGVEPSLKWRQFSQWDVSSARAWS
jgi:PAC2 family